MMKRILILVLEIWREILLNVGFYGIMVLVINVVNMVIFGLRMNNYLLVLVGIKFFLKNIFLLLVSGCKILKGFVLFGFIWFCNYVVIFCFMSVR